METSPGSSPTYEFSAPQNETIARAARWIGFWSFVALGTGLLAALSVLGGESAADRVASALFGLVYLAIGMLFFRAAGSMKSVVETEGDDIEHLMSALDRLGSAFKIMGILVIVSVVIVLVGVLVLASAATTAGG